jgi:hypothetical protein
MRSPDVSAPPERATLELPIDPSYAVTLRIFVASVGAGFGIPPSDLDDLRLAATELFRSAEGTASSRFRLELTSDRDDWTMFAHGIGDVEAVIDDLGFRRLDLLTGLFPAIALSDGTASVRGPLARPETPVGP